jgi:hypothetical protein
MLAGVFLSLRIEQGWPPGPNRPIELAALPAPKGPGS